jgi:glycosyltransferase involved in cell wall biosynthesis
MPSGQRASDEGASGSPAIRVAINAIAELAAGYGSHVYLLNLARELSRAPLIHLTLLVRAGQEDSLPADLRRFARGIAIPADRSYWQIFFQNRISEFLVKESIDVYHLPNTLPFLRKVVPTVVTIHDLIDLRVRKYGWARTLYRRGVNFSAARLADRVLTVSENSKADIVSLLRVPEEKVSVIFNGVDSTFRVLDRELCKKKVQQTFSVTRDFILAPGGLSRNKNIPVLLEAFSELKASGIPNVLMVTGSGNEGEIKVVRDHVRKLRLEDDVILTGYIPVSDMPAIYNACSMVVYPTLYEGFGLPAVEAMACGAALITSNISSLPELVGDAALLVDPRSPLEIFEAMALLFREAGVRERLLQKGFDRVKRFTWRAAAEQTVEIYRECASR